MNYQLIGDNTYTDPIHTVLQNRKLDKDVFYNLSEKVIIHHSNLKNIYKAVDCVLHHIKMQSPIFVQVDPDCDGYMSAAILINYLNKTFPENKINWRVQEDKTHGVIIETVPNESKLVIVPDAGSNEYKVHKELKSNGIDVLVIDHHESEFESTDAIVVNNQLSDNYNNKMLSGAGMAYKFCKALDERLKVNFADDYLDLVAIGNIGDMMDLRSPETRFYVKEGLKKIRNPLIKEILDKQSYFLKGDVNISFVAFSINPLINASIRVGDLEEKKDLMKALLESEEKVYYSRKKVYEPLITSVTRRIGNTRNRQKNALEKPVKLLLNKVKNEGKSNDKVIVLDYTGLLDTALRGLVANQLSKRFKRPVLLGALTEEGKVEGSARGYEKGNISDFKEVLHKTGLFESCEGHSNAFGFTITPSNFKTLHNRLNDFIDVPVNFDDKFDVDFIIPFTEMNPDIIEQIYENDDEWGSTVEEPLIAIEEIEVNKSNIKIYKKRTSTFVIKLDGFKLSKPYYKGEFDQFFENGEESFFINVVGRCKVQDNKYRFIEIVDLEVTGSFLF
ncbi:DHH family phosphoesterase [Bacillus atrophaeus]|uniref:DHH family phosphoesterase n=1 Tax=Bacillus atrophaeus TaxID=1452 RepID=UPI002DB721A6|nr:DHH family phosphoesterase [Bacillus atrophaeus]MEC2307709.1 DHH family phosphoesterase [Bacillus atrophaeus]